MKQISFCITCMNRLKHLQETLEKNILDNFLVDEVEFVVLDYNSQDGLEEWIAQSMMKYIEMGILVYYRTTEPVHYLRSQKGKSYAIWMLITIWGRALLSLC